ncbi:MAG: flippase-like domain-containing protein [Pseudomonadales bacterium]|nr:flippase-like domain-containing protein [Pseudomonadales bacterium]
MNSTDTDLPADPPRRLWIGRLLRVLNLLVLSGTLGFLGHYFWTQSPNWQFDDFHLNSGLLITAAALTLIYQIYYAFGWVLTSRSAGIRMPVLPAMGIWGFSLFGKYLPGKIAVLAYRTLILTLQQRAKPQQVLLAWALESAASIIAGLAVLALSMTALGMRQLGVDITIELLIGALAGIMLLAALGTYRPIRNLVFRLVRLESATDGVTWWAFNGLIFYYAGGWVLLGSILWFLIGAIEMQAVTWQESILVYSAAGISGMLTVIAPSGFGVRESVMVLLLSPHLAPAAALAVSLLARVIATLGDVFAMAAGYTVIKLLNLESPPADAPGEARA